MDINQIKALEKELVELEQLYIETIALAKEDKKISKKQKVNLSELKVLLKKCRKCINLEKKKLVDEPTKEEDISPILKDKFSELDRLLIELKALKQLSA